MKTPKSLVLVVGMAVAAVLLGASTPPSTSGTATLVPDRPPKIPEARWIPLSPVSGFVVSVDVADPKFLAGLNGRDIAGVVLYVKTKEKGWCRARIDNPLQGLPVSP
jgi:hypothetical protein